MSTPEALILISKNNFPLKGRGLPWAMANSQTRAQKIQNESRISYPIKQGHIQGMMGTYQMDTESSMK